MLQILCKDRYVICRPVPGRHLARYAHFLPATCLVNKSVVLAVDRSKQKGGSVGRGGSARNLNLEGVRSLKRKWITSRSMRKCEYHSLFFDEY